MLMKLIAVALACVLTQCLSVDMNMRSTTVQLIEEVYNRKDALALDKFYALDATYKDNMFNQRMTELRGLDRIRNLHFSERCPIFNMLGAVFTMEDSVVSTQTNTIRYVLAVHGVMLNKYKNDILRLSVLHKFNSQGNKIISTQIFGDLTSLYTRLSRDKISENSVNRMKALRVHDVLNTHRQYNVLNDMVANDAKVYVPEFLSKGALSWTDLMKLQRGYDKCFENQKSEVKYVLHEQSRPNEVAIVWKWTAIHSAQCPTPYGQIKPLNKEINVCGVAEYKFCRVTGQITQIRLTYDSEDLSRQMQGNKPSSVSTACENLSSSNNVDKLSSMSGLSEFTFPLLA